jgi:hypothetical protein
MPIATVLSKTHKVIALLKRADLTMIFKITLAFFNELATPLGQTLTALIWLTTH